MIDTGGIEVSSSDQFQNSIKSQAIASTEESDVIVFIVDGKTGIQSEDEEVAQILKRSKKPIMLVVNKIDEPGNEHDIYEFYKLGIGEPYAISALHGHGTGDFLDEMILKFPDNIIEEDDDTIKLTYGFKEKTLKDGDTWDNIAFETYGDSSLGILLASYNGTLTEESSSEIVPGKTVYIPILDEVKSTSNNEVYNEPGVIDNYGKDIAIQNGDFGEQNGDLAIVNGLNNLTQAILFRLCTSINNRIRNTVYGIKSSVGYSVAIANKYLASSITQTVLTDPRVSEIQSLQWEGSGSELKINFSYTDINDQNQSYGGE